jgi:hypothetical protein
MPLLTSIMAASRRRVDPDAADYFARIAAAGSSISEPNKVAVNAFVAGCKADGIWAAIKASCLLAGPDDLTGALVPLVGAAPTNNGPFVSGDHNRTTGLVGNGSTKYLNSNRTADADPQNNRHLSSYLTVAASDTATKSIMGTDLTQNQCHILTSAGEVRVRYGSAAQFTAFVGNPTGFHGLVRTNFANFISRAASTNVTHNSTSSASSAINIGVFGRLANTPTDARISFYSIGESLNLALLDARLATYMSALT